MPNRAPTLSLRPTWLLRSLIATSLSATACSVFDAGLYEGRLDGGSPETDDAALGAGDGGARDGGAADTGAQVLRLSDRCDGVVPVATPNVPAYAIDTRSLADDFSQLAACTGFDAPGNDGFFSVEMTAGEKWHFHVRVPQGMAINPSVYVLSSCDERACQPGSGLDECGAGRDEHVSFTAPTTGRYLVGVDTREAGGSSFTLLVVRARCGNGAPLEHGESCDDGNTMSGDGCDSSCRAEMSPARLAEVEPNDDSTNANVVRPTGGTATDLVLTGRVGGRCDFDMYSVSVPDGGFVHATILDTNGQPCGAAAPDLKVSLVRPDGLTTGGMGVVEGGNSCPVIGPGHAFSENLAAGEYFVRVTTAGDEATAFDYRLHLQAGP